MKDAARVKLFVREVEGLPPDATRSKDRDNRKTLPPESCRNHL